jgi:hypothetical protein
MSALMTLLANGISSPSAVVTTAPAFPTLDADSFTGPDVPDAYDRIEHGGLSVEVVTVARDSPGSNLPSVVRAAVP